MQTQKYLVSVDGRGAPTVEHNDINAALAEAERLASQPANAKQTVRVLAQVAVLTPVKMPTHQWVAQAPELTQQPATAPQGETA